MKPTANNPKYSVVLPTLNGAETLSVTMPAMLRAIERDDVEWVISDNHSDDHTYQLIAGLGDPRVRLVQPPQRLPAGQHLEFAYSQARGEWQGHLGDDDYLFPSRFAVLDEIIAHSQATLVRGEYVRYHWPDYPNEEFANGLDARTFSNSLRIIRGSDLAALSLNERVVYGGGAWCVHHSIIEQVRARCGFFSSPQHVEFFAMRAAMTLSPTVALTELPIYVIGRHEKSSISQAIRPKSETTHSRWDWSFEDPDPWQYNPFQYKGYAPISLDAALMVRALFPEYLGHAQINWLYWIIAIFVDLGTMIRHEQLPPEAIEIFRCGLQQLPPRTRLRWWLSQRPLLEQLAITLRAMLKPTAAQPTAPALRSISGRPFRQFGWAETLYGETIGVHSIVEVPRWVEGTFSWFFPSAGPSSRCKTGGSSHK